MNCTRCNQYPCRCTGNVDVIADYHDRIRAPTLKVCGSASEATLDADGLPLGYASGPPRGTRILPQHKYDRVGSLGACRETRDGYHVVEAGDNVCILCFTKVGGTPVRVPVRTSPATPSNDSVPTGAVLVEEPWSL